MSFSSVFREIYSLAPSRRIVFQLLKYMTLCIFAIFFLLFMVSFLPQNPLRNNIIQASNEGYFDDNYPSPDYLFIFDNRIDMYTECVGIGASAQLEPNIYSILSMKFFENCPDLKNGINNNFTGIYSYYRYIHGYQIVLKSLYTYFKIKNVRICIFLVTAILLCIMFIVLGKNITVNYSLIIFLSFFITKSSDVFIIATHASQFWIVIIATCCAVLFRHRMHPFAIFGTIGAVDTCFSFLNMGSLSLGLPLLCYSLSIWNDNERSDKNVALQFYACIGWCIGFISPWVVKWCLVLIVFDISIPELFGDTLNSYPTGSLDRIFLAIFRDVSELHWLLGSIVLFILWRRKKCKSIPIRKDLLPALLPALIPFIWIAIIPGQAGIKHSSFYNLILWPAIAAIFLLFLSLPSKRHDRLVSDSNSPAKYMSSDNL